MSTGIPEEIEAWEYRTVLPLSGAHQPFHRPQNAFPPD
jgi:hypothetical protein